MATAKKVNWSLNAMLMLGEPYDYLEEQMGDVKAQGYLDELMDFGNALDFKSTHHSFCRQKTLQENELRCARFKNRYFIVYKTDAISVDILAVLHVKRGPEAFEELV